MPSPVAHAIGGVAVAWVADRTPDRATSARVTIACAALGALPDADLLFPIAHRTVSHSVIAVAVILLVMSIAAAVTGKVTLRIAVTCAAAYASHLLLDWLAGDPTPPHGIQVLWPMSSRWFISGLNLFRATEREHFLELATIKQNFVAVVQEMTIMVPVAAAAWLVRVKTLSRLAPQLSRRHHSLQ
jgi:membrane-bound metal-dependent hydrolase YbcI (DUF457 family)